MRQLGKAIKYVSDLRCCIHVEIINSVEVIDVNHTLKINLCHSEIFLCFFSQIQTGKYKNIERVQMYTLFSTGMLQYFLNF